MKYASLTIWIIFFVSLCTSCQDDPVVQPQADTMLRFSVVTADESIVNTRSGNKDETLQNIYVLVFDGDGEDAKVIDWVKATSAGSTTYHATLKPSITEGTIYILANIEYDMVGNIADLQKGGTLKQVKDGLLVKLTQQNGNVIQNPINSPMVSESQTYIKGVTGEMNFTLTRATAKVTVADESNDANFELVGANLGSAPAKGYVFNTGTPITEVANYAGQEAGNYSPEYMMEGISTTTPKTTNPLYLFDSPAANKTFVIIKGNYKGIVGYHKLGLLTTDKKKSLDINRNYQYIIHIKKVATAGYATAEEAIKNEPSNRDIDYDITVEEPSSHDIITNGEQYLGVSNSSLIIYQSGNKTDFPALKLSYTTATTWQPGSITAIGNGLSMSNGQKTMSLSGTTTSEKEIGINFDNTFKTGTLTIRIGDLCKVINIKRYNNLTAVPDEMEFDGVAIADCSESPIKKLIRFTEKSGIYDQHADDEVFVSNTQKIYGLISPNIGYGNTLTERDGEFYVASGQDEGRTKIFFHQEKLDVYKGSIQIQPYSFVGVFHRWNQTAERIIRIKTIATSSEATWVARVIVGEDFIELDEHRSPDTGITEYPYGCKDIDNPNPSSPTDADHAQWTSDADIEANCQFTPEQKNKIMVTGKGQNVYFRVGMKSKLANESAAPRYGLIALKYMTQGGTEGTHFIYVRQGEQADYLMRPQDKVNSVYGGNVITMGSRQDAVKILPYNITTPSGHETDLYYDIPNEGGALASYPSQGGYFFKGNSRRAYYPVGTGTFVGFRDSGTDGNICPTGYRKPNDGVDANPGFVNGSEMRQSFWLNPRNGEWNSSFDNALRGYIADGYYDRRIMRVPNTQGRKNEGVANTIYTSETIGTTMYTIPTMVEDGSACGYAGMLLYNPYNYASIFIPANGSRTLSAYGFSGEIRGTGIESNIWSSSTASPYGMWYLAIGVYSNSFVFDNYSSTPQTEGYSIRCVTK